MSVASISLTKIVSSLALAASVVTLSSIIGTPAFAETAAEVAKKPVVPPKPARLADGHPNWTGFWVPVNGLLQVDIGLGGSPELQPGAKPPPPPIPFGDFPPLKSPYREKLAAFFAKMIKDGEVADPVAKCFPPGMPRMMGMVYGMELLQTAGQVAITSEWQAASRRIWLDRKDHPPADELDPTYAGDSVGHWEGDTLFVDTVGIRDDVPLNYTGLTHSGKVHIKERFTQVSPGILQIEFTITDPDVFTKPWVHLETYRYRPDLRIREYVCLENNRNVGENGQASFDK